MKIIILITSVLFLPGCLSIQMTYYTYPLPIQSYRGTVIHVKHFPLYRKTAPGYRLYGPFIMFVVGQSFVDLCLCAGLDTLLLPATLPVDIYGIFYPEDFEYYRARAMSEDY